MSFGQFVNYKHHASSPFQHPVTAPCTRRSRTAKTRDGQHLGKGAIGPPTGVICTIECHIIDSRAHTQNRDVGERIRIVVRPTA
jgi:hypothetical protein